MRSRTAPMTSSARSCRLAPATIPPRRCRPKPISATSSPSRRATARRRSRHAADRMRTSPTGRRPFSVVSGPPAADRALDRRIDTRARRDLRGVQPRAGAACQHRHDRGLCRNRARRADGCRHVAKAERIRGGCKSLSPQTDGAGDDTQTEVARKTVCQEAGRGAERRGQAGKGRDGRSKAEDALPVEKLPVPTEQAELVVQDKPAEKPQADDAEEKKPESKWIKKDPRSRAPRQG